MIEATLPKLESLIQAPTMISSFDQKPASGKTPALASDAAMKVQKVIGMYLRRPPILRMSCSSCMPWITEPQPRKSRPLKKACVIRWKIAASHAPVPSAKAM